MPNEDIYSSSSLDKHSKYSTYKEGEYIEYTAI
jgi:hypothetical protein